MNASVILKRKETCIGRKNTAYFLQEKGDASDEEERL